MENDWEPMKNRNSWVLKERLEKKFGTMAHMKGKKRKGPQLIDGRILGERTAGIILFISNLLFYFNLY